MSTVTQLRYDFIRSQIHADFPPPARIVELGAAPGDQIVRLAADGYESTAVDIGIASDEWGQGEVGRMNRLFAEAGVNYVEWNLEETLTRSPESGPPVVGVQRPA